MNAYPALTSTHEFEVVQEDDLVASRKVTAVVIGAVVITVASVAVSGMVIDAATGHLAPSARTVSIAPRQIDGIHQTPIERDRHGWDLRERQRRSLDAYRWVDRPHGIAQIPIEQAMQMIADEDARQRGTR